ncbi:MAG TPA: iron-containing redox enzyme family protein [Burkholderiaceae bacterium]
MTERGNKQEAKANGNQQLGVAGPDHAQASRAPERASNEFIRTGSLMDLASYPAWAQDMIAASLPAKRQVVEHPVFAMLAQGTLPPQATRNFLLAGWPVIEQFPQYMAVNLCKIRYGRSSGEDQARRYLLRNIRVEQNHADHWVAWALACGVSKAELLGSDVPVECHALSHWCWHCCERDSLATSMAATNLAIEGATGEWSHVIVAPGLYEQTLPPGARSRAMRWLKLHAEYDDTHPWEALSIICSLLGTRADAAYVAFLSRCIVKSYAYMAMSLDRCLADVPASV